MAHDDGNDGTAANTTGDVIAPTDNFIKVLLRDENGYVRTRDAKRYDLLGSDVAAYLGGDTGDDTMSLIVNREATVQRYGTSTGLITISGDVSLLIHYFPPSNTRDAMVIHCSQAVTTHASA